MRTLGAIGLGLVLAAALTVRAQTADAGVAPRVVNPDEHPTTIIRELDFDEPDAGRPAAPLKR